MKKPAAFMVLFAGLLVAQISMAQNREFPQGPDPRITPGSYCTQPTEYRYPAHIPYCERNVTSGEKNQIFAVYRQQLGYRLDPSHRSSYKIDHLIPLCAGGSNKSDNLWPQHISVYQKTDPIEPLVCELMSRNKISQKDAIRLVFTAKHDLSRVSEVMQILNKLR